MGKRYKAGNVGKRRKKTTQKTFINREKKLNTLINEFMDIIFHKPLNFKNYDHANQLRLDIKMNFDIQGKDINRHGRKRRNIYYSQLAKFKSVYTYWKKISYDYYIIRRYKLPERYLKAFRYYKKYYMGSYPYRQIF